MKKVLCCGGRDFEDYWMVKRVLDEVKPDVIIHGGARGADTLCGNWAELNCVAVFVYRADWRGKGKAAGPIRNQEMLDDNPNIELVIAFAGGRGTADMIRRARAKGIEVREIKSDSRQF